MDFVIFTAAALAGLACLAMTVRDARRRDDTDHDAHTRLARGHLYEELPVSEKQDAMALWPQLAVACFLIAGAVLVF